MNALYPSFESSWANDRSAPAPSSVADRHSDALHALSFKKLISKEARSLEAHRGAYDDDRPLPPFRPGHVETMAIDPITNVRLGTFQQRYEFNQACKAKREEFRRRAGEGQRAPELFSGTVGDGDSQGCFGSLHIAPP